MKNNPHKYLDVMKTIQIPRDLSHREAVITIIGTGEIYIENYRKILEYTNTCIRIRCKTDSLKVLGSHLNIAYYSNDEMKITGQFQHIFFE